MARDATKSGTATRTEMLARRGVFGRGGGARTERMADAVFGAPGTWWAVLIWGAFVVVCGSLATWSRNQPLVAVNRVMNFTALARVDFSVEDRVRTEQNKVVAQRRTPRVYRMIPAVVETIGTSIENLPRTVENAETPDQVIPEVRAQFRLTPDGLAAIRSQVSRGEISLVWKQKTKQLVEMLPRRPLLDEATYQRENQEGASIDVEVRTTGEDGKDRSEMLRRTDLVSIKDERELHAAMRRLAEDAGFTEPALSVVVSRLTTEPRATFDYAEEATVAKQNQSARSVATVSTRIPNGQVIFRRGDILNETQFDQYKRELAAYAMTAEPYRVWLRTMSVFGAVAAIAVAIAGYLALFCPKVHRDPKRTAGVAGLIAAALGLSCLGTVMNPSLLTLTAIAPTVFVAVLLVIAYEQRVALALGTLHGVLTCVALDQPIGVYALGLTGVSFAVFQLREIRDRHGILKMGLYVAASLGVGTILIALIDRPILWEARYHTLADAALAGVGGIGVGVLTLALLPTVERAFDITTGMTLIELRDPKQPLLRQLQQRAPGTYNHSLNVASIAEAASDSIKADGLLTYVGALYHDIGKMNKPEYFVENQSGGPNKHDKLSPAMSLLVIVGHVKDGMAMAEEARLPRSIQHFIEAHHGTTLVEYFYNRARKQAEQAGRGEPDLPEEIEYRYPGPRPRTKECAILMLADAVESATRTMAEPTPSRIEALVRALANKRLMDGQFDECELTLRELQTICESISKTVASIYHGRVLYPSTSGEAEREEKRA